MFHFFSFFDKTIQFRRLLFVAQVHAVLGCSPALHAPKEVKKRWRKKHEEKSFDLLKFDTGVRNTVHAHTPHQSFLANQSLFRSAGAAVTADASVPAPSYTITYTFLYMAQTKRIVISWLATHSSAWLCSFTDAENKRQQRRKYSMWWFLCHAFTHNSYNII